MRTTVYRASGALRKIVASPVRYDKDSCDLREKGVPIDQSVLGRLSRYEMRAASSKYYIPDSHLGLSTLSYYAMHTPAVGSGKRDKSNWIDEVMNDVLLSQH
jgi:hypothetical protein